MSVRKRTSHVSPTHSEVVHSGPSKRAHTATTGTDADPHVVLSSSDDGSDVEMLGEGVKMEGITGVEDEKHKPSVLAVDFKGKGRVTAQLPTPPVGSPPPTSQTAGPSTSKPAYLSPAKQWSEDFKQCKEMWGGKEGGYAHEDASGEAMIKRLRAGDADNSITCSASFLDEEETPQTLILSLTVTELESYPHSYSILLYPEDDSPPKHLAEALEYFPTAIIKLTLPQLVRKVLRSLQGEAMSEAPTLDDTDGAYSTADEDWEDYGGGTMGGGKKNVKGLQGIAADPKIDYERLKKDFKEIVAAGFRPGLVRISDDEIIISISALFRELDVPVETLERWDERLAESYHRSRLILLMNIGPSYPPKKIGTEWQKSLAKPAFWVGLGDDYKPSVDTIKKTCWKAYAKPLASLASDLVNPEDHPTRPSDFLPFLLSAPLASLMNEQFTALINSRTRMNTPAPGKKANPKFGWAASEKLIAESSSAGGTGVGTSNVSKEMEKKMKLADKEEKALKRSLPDDSWATGRDNYIQMAFEYLVRRFTLSTLFCLNCYNPVEVESLRPYVCSKELCIYAYQGLGLGPPVEYEIRENPRSVDLLVTFAYIALKEGNDNSLPPESLPHGLHIDVEPKLMTPTNLPIGYQGITPPSGKLSFDDLETLVAKKEALTTLIDQLPRISILKEGLDKGKNLDQIAPLVPRGAWGALRWIVASNTSYLKQTAYDERITSITDADSLQFKFVVGSPAKEVAFKDASAAAAARNPHSALYPTILAFHGSPARNWHNILRVGLNHNYVGNARAYGHGVYFACQGEISMQTYAQHATSQRANSDFTVSSCSALVEIVNARSEFVSSSPYLVVAETNWCQPRYLIVKGSPTVYEEGVEPEALPPVRQASMTSKACQDPTYKLTIGHQEVLIAQSESRARAGPIEQVDHDDWTIEDRAIIFGSGRNSPMEVIELSSDEEADSGVPAFVPSDPERLELCHLLPPPTGTATATRALTLAFKALVAEQSSKNPGGVYVDPESESLYSWVVELHSFPADSQIHKDLVKHDLPSVLAEIRYPASFPFSPPFVRILHPRFLNFAAGGGGHITAGGSICSELLTSTGWNAAYTISAVLTELATNMTVAPEAKLDPVHWNTPYTTHEAAEAYKRVAMQHGWAVPADFAKLF